MWNPISLKIVNVFAHKETLFTFNSNELTLIYGINGKRSNGSGKSSILDCIAIALTGSPLKNLGKKDLVRNDQVSGEVELLLENEFLKKELLIKRSLHASKTNRVEIYENRELNTQLKDLNPKESDKYILQLLGISHDDLMNYFLISKERYESFFLSGDSTKKEIINRFSKANLIDALEAPLKKEVDDYTKEITRLEVDISSCVAKISVLTEQLTSLKQIDPSEARQKHIDSLLENVEGNLVLIEQGEKAIELIKQSITLEKSKLPTNISELEVAINSSETEINALTEDISVTRQLVSKVSLGYETSKNTIKENIKKQEVEIKTAKQTIKELNSFIAEIEANISDSIECPKCHHKFILRDKEFNIEEAKLQLPEVKREVEETEKNITKLTEIVSGYEFDLMEINHKIEAEELEYKNTLATLNTTLSTLTQQKNADSLKLKTQQSLTKSIENVISGLEGKLTSQQNSINLYAQHNESILSRIEEIEREEVAMVDLKPTLANIETQEKSMESYEEALISLTEQRTLAVSWQSYFKRFKSFLANKSIRVIQDYSNYYLQQMKSTLSVFVDGYRELANKTLKEEINILVSRDGGMTHENFAKYSGGEKAEADLSCILSMQKIINSTSQSGGLNLLCIDEVLESLDALGLEQVVKAFSNIPQTLIMVSHVDPDKKFDCKSIIVEKTNSIARIL